MDSFLETKSQGGLFPHTHTLKLPKSAVDNPPKEGITLETSPEYSLVFKHKHQVHISAAELAALKNGKAVTVKDTDKGRHSFTFA